MSVQTSKKFKISNLKFQIVRGFTLIRTLDKSKNLDKVQPFHGFTLIELLVVISIIGILVSFTASRYQTAEKQARDTKRKSDLNQYRVALENYSVANNSLYPTPVGSTCVDSATSLCDGTFKTNFLPSCPDDSRKGDTNYYQYCASGTSYTLNSMLETSGKIWQVCSVGQSCLTTQTTYQTTNACLCP